MRDVASDAGLAGAALGLLAGYLNYRVLTLMMDLHLRSLRNEEPEPGAERVLARMAWLRPRALALLLIVFPAVGFVVGRTLGHE